MADDTPLHPKDYEALRLKGSVFIKRPAPSYNRNPPFREGDELTVKKTPGRATQKIKVTFVRWMYVPYANIPYWNIELTLASGKNA